MNIIDQTITTEATNQNVRLILPVLVHWAKTGRKDGTYGDLIHAIGKSQFSGIGHALGAAQSVLEALAEQTGRYIPTLNSLCKKEKNMLPSEGFEFVSPTYNTLDKNGKRVFVEGLDSEAIGYPYWDWVLEQLGLKAERPFSAEELESIKNPGGKPGGEGAAHRALKEYIGQHPECLYDDVVFADIEHVLPSGDRMDVYFELSGGTRIGVEVKPDTSDESEINRGLFQCVKYQAVMEALRTIECADYEIEVLLVTTGRFSPENMKLASELCVTYHDGFEMKV